MAKKKTTKKKSVKKDIKPLKIKCKDKWYQKLYKTLLYDETRKKLSRTALMNMIFFAMAVSLFFIGIYFAIFSPARSISNDLFIYVGSLTGGSFLQYSYGKKISGGGK